ncbi:alpha-L-fucosidase C-terminal domain-containing protein [Bacteroides cutis]|mgnify:FL=1|uniref:alpha-L-fucosidase C-terminal domain-containing protein n=1 Tax=Bacteroides cutis TaxID=2024197 RepID=UPI0015E104BB|nr:alpha-L-fucosidase C-terminal domain-containing protein [Bacteroides cutis]
MYDDTPQNLVQDIRFTQKGQTLYVIARSWRDKEVFVKTLQKTKYPAKALSLLGCESRIQWKQDKKGVKITLPESVRQQDNTIPAYVFTVELANNK